MRSSNLIIFLIFIAAIAGGGYFLYKNKDKLLGNKQDDDTAKDKTNVTPQTGYARPKVVSKANAGVKELQKQLNSKLPASYPKLDEDGIWGPKTQAAFEYMQEQGDSGNLGIDGEQFMKKYAQLTNYAFNKTPLKYTPMAGAYKAAKDIGNWAKNKFKSWY